MPVRISLLYGETVYGSVAGVDQTVVLADLVQGAVDRLAALAGDVELPAELAHKTDSQRPDGVAGNLVVTGQ